MPRSYHPWRCRAANRSGCTVCFSTRGWISPADDVEASGRGTALSFRLFPCRLPVSALGGLGAADGGDDRGAARAYPDLVASAALGRVERLVGRAQQRLGLCGVVGEDRDAQGGGDAQETAAFLAHGGTDRLGPAAGALNRGVGEHQREFLAAVTAGDVAAADMALEQRRDLDQEDRKSVG